MSTTSSSGESYRVAAFTPGGRKPRRTFESGGRRKWVRREEPTGESNSADKRNQDAVCDKIDEVLKRTETIESYLSSGPSAKDKKDRERPADIDTIPERLGGAVISSYPQKSSKLYDILNHIASFVTVVMIFVNTMYYFSFCNKSYAKYDEGDKLLCEGINLGVGIMWLLAAFLLIVCYPVAFVVLRYFITYQQLVIFKKCTIKEMKDLRGDIEAISDLVHRKVVETEIQLGERWGLSLPILFGDQDVLTVEPFLYKDFIYAEPTVDEEQLSQLLVHSVCPPNSDRDTVWARINQVNKTLHTVNYNRANYLSTGMTRQETAAVAMAIYVCYQSRISKMVFRLSLVAL